MPSVQALQQSPFAVAAVIFFAYGCIQTSGFPAQAGPSHFLPAVAPVAPPQLNSPTQPVSPQPPTPPHVYPPQPISTPAELPEEGVSFSSYILPSVLCVGLVVGAFAGRTISRRSPAKAGAVATSPFQTQAGTAVFGARSPRREMVAMKAGDTIQFWSPGFGPYSQRVWITLLEKKLPYELNKVDLTNKSTDFVDTYRSVNPEETFPAKVPMVTMPDGFTMIESDVVVDYLIAKYSGEGAELMPDSPEGWALVRLFIELFDKTVGDVHMLEWVRGEGTKSTYTMELVKHLRTLDAFLQVHQKGDGPFLCGEAFTLAEIHAAPLLIRAVAQWEYFQDIKLLMVCEEMNFPRLEKWIKAVLARPSVVESSESIEDLIDEERFKLVWKLF